MFSALVLCIVHCTYFIVFIDISLTNQNHVIFVNDNITFSIHRTSSKFDGDVQNSLILLKTDWSEN